MSAITYTAVDRGKLTSGHSSLTEYTIDVPIASFESTSQNVGSMQRSLSGVPFKTLHRIENSASFSTILLHKVHDATLIAEIDEFFNSVAGGESFIVDVYGSSLSVDELVQYTLSGSHTKSVVDSVFFQYSFEAVEL